MQVYALVRSDTDFLLARKRVRNRFWGGAVGVNNRVVNQAGQWALPGGAMDDGEEYVDTASREFYEETGVDLWNYCYEDDADVLMGTGEYAVVEFQVTGADLATIAQTAFFNLEPSPGNANSPRGNGVRDWELEFASMFPLADAGNFLGVREVVPGGAVGGPAHRQAIDWYAEIGETVAGL